MASKKQKENTSADQSVGVVLIAFGSAQYFQMAYNLAYSIKHFNKSIQIAVYIDSRANFNKALLPSQHWVFDFIEETSDKFGQYAELKLNIDKYCRFDKSLYLDVDSIAVRDIEPLLVSLDSIDYAVHVNGKYQLSDGEKFPQMWWAKPADIWEHYKLPEDATLWSVNSSIQWITSGKQSKEIYEKARKAYKNAIPVTKLLKTWGNGQPDELYLNIALAQSDFDPSFPIDAMLFRAKIMELPHTIPASYDFMSYFGPQGHTAYYYVQWMDNMLRTYHQKDGLKHYYKIQNILKYKHANRR
jgi:lipopolysaccharide biosynthesis glycosyltransferase